MNDKRKTKQFKKNLHKEKESKQIQLVKRMTIFFFHNNMLSRISWKEKNNIR